MKFRLGFSIYEFLTASASSPESGVVFVLMEALTLYLSNVYTILLGRR